MVVVVVVVVVKIVMGSQSQLRSWCRGLHWMEGHLTQLFTAERGWNIRVMREGSRREGRGGREKGKKEGEGRQKRMRCYAGGGREGAGGREGGSGRGLGYYNSK
jgi:hypothetical protein